MKKDLRSFLSFLLIMVVNFLAIALAITSNVSLRTVIKNYQFNVIVILIAMELFSNLISSTGIMARLALKISIFSRGMQKKILVWFAALMFLVSAFLNNITAVLMVLPIIFMLIKSIGVDRKYVNVFFACLLASCNVGGASSPIGDFPAIVIMSSGITSFAGYLLRAFPFFLITIVILIFWWKAQVKEDNSSRDKKMLSVDLLHSRYKNIKIKKDLLVGLVVIFLFMFVGWIFIPQTLIPGEIVAMFGCIVGMFYSSLKGAKVDTYIDLKSILNIASFLFLASVISQTGILSYIAGYLQNNIDNPKLLLIVIMFLTSLVAGLFGAGPAASAMMPVIVYMCNQGFFLNSDWVAIGYAASICAGSSLFVWSATSGFILSNNINSANLVDDSGKISWGIKEYFMYGIQNYLLQMSISIVILFFVL